MSPSVENVHLRDRKDLCVDPAEVAIERQPVVLRRRRRHRERDADRGVGAETLLVLAAVQIDQQGVDGNLIGGIKPREGRGDHAVDVLDRPQHPLAEVAAAVPIPKLDRLGGAGGGAGRHGGSSAGAVLEDDVHLEGRVAS